MGWCDEHLRSGCVFSYDESLLDEHCPQWAGDKCTLVHIMLTVHRLPAEVRRKVITALYPAYGIAPLKDAADRPRSPKPRSES
jgi:hypothetical protein